jgi:uncharacterized protein (DUF2132 family)
MWDRMGSSRIDNLISDSDCDVEKPGRKTKESNPSMSDPQANNPLHGRTLEYIVNSLVEHFGWTELGSRINIRCFNNDPSVNSSLKFLRKTPWARKKVEDLYISILKRDRQWPHDQNA